MKQEFSDSILDYMNGNFNKAYNKLILNGVYSDEEIDLLSYICYFSGRFADFINTYNKVCLKSNSKSFHANEHTKILDDKKFIFPRVTKPINQSIERPDESYIECDECKKIMEMRKAYIDKEIESLKKICSSRIKEFENKTLFTFPFSCGSPVVNGPNDKNIKNFIINNRNYAKDFFTLGEVLYSKKHFNLAFKYYKLAILFEPNKAIYYGYCAQAIYLSEDLSNSKEHMLYGDWLCDRSIRLDSKNPRWHFIRSNHLIVFSKNFEISSLTRAYSHIKKAKALCQFENKALEKRVDNIYNVLHEINSKKKLKVNDKLNKIISNNYISHFKNSKNAKLIFEKGIDAWISLLEDLYGF